MTDKFDIDAQKEALVSAALEHVPFEGWTVSALRHAAKDIDMDLQLALMLFDDPVGEMIEVYIRMSDAQMRERLEAQGFEDMKVREKVTACVRTRMEIADEHKEATMRAVRCLAQPKYAKLSAKTLWRTADEIWRLCGDTATDYNHYTKRTILSGVYSSTLLYWLQDESDGYEDTWAFLDRRIAGVMQFEKVKADVLKAKDKLPSLTRFLGRLRYPA